MTFFDLYNKPTIRSVIFLRNTHSLGVSMKYGLDGRLQRGLRARDQILPAALRAFACEGFTGLSLARLAEELGMGKSTLLHHFAARS